MEQNSSSYQRWVGDVPLQFLNNPSVGHPGICFNLTMNLSGGN